MSDARKKLNFKPSEEHIKKIIDLSSKNFNLISPTGEHVTGKNISLFCREHNLSQGCLSAVINGRRKTHKGWTKFVATG